MNPLQTLFSNNVDAKITQKTQVVEVVQKTSSEKMTRGERLADKLAAEVGSWRFLISQSLVLAGWVGINLTPGLPHWDESPFMMLNLVFSFASAYTAPVVLMSQNRQSEIDRKKAEHNHNVNLRSGQNVELLHEKLDDLHTKQLNDLTQIVKQQQEILQELKLTLIPTSKTTTEFPVGTLSGIYVQTDSKFSQPITVNKSFLFDQAIADNYKLLDKLSRK
jgi:uncharacterized membrane protein